MRKDQCGMATKKAAKKAAKKTKGEAKVEKVMGEFKRGELQSGSGDKVTNRKQAVAIALSEAREAGARIPKKKPAAKKTGKKAAAKKSSKKNAG